MGSQETLRLKWHLVIHEGSDWGGRTMRIGLRRLDCGGRTGGSDVGSNEVEGWD